MGLLVDHQNDVAWLAVGVLVGLSVESVLLAMGCALVDVCRQNLALLDDLLTIASLALVFLRDGLA